MKLIIILLDVILALGGFVGGRAFVRDPSGASLRMPVAWLKKVPLIKNYFWPGVFLLIAYALGGTIAAAGTLSNQVWADEFNMALGTVLMGWVLIELLFIPERNPMQLLFFILGGALVVMPLL